MEAATQGLMIRIATGDQLGAGNNNSLVAVVISSEEYNCKTKLVIVVPVVEGGKGNPFEVQVEGQDGSIGYALSDQVRSMDFSARDIEPCGFVPHDVLKEILARTRTLFW